MTFLPYKNVNGAKGSWFPRVAHLMVVKIPEHDGNLGLELG